MKKVSFITLIVLIFACLMAFSASAEEVTDVESAKEAFNYLGYSFVVDSYDSENNAVVSLSCSLTRNQDIVFGEGIKYGLAIAAKDVVGLTYLNNTIIGTNDGSNVALIDLTSNNNVAKLGIKVTGITSVRYEAQVYMCLYVTDGENIAYLSHTGWGDEPSPISYRQVNPQTAKFTSTFKNTSKYVYRVGNTNSIKLGSLFKTVNNIVFVDSSAVEVEIAKVNSSSNVTGTYTKNTSDWTQSTIEFEGTGVVAVSIKTAGGEAYTLNLEVVNAKNVTAYSELTNASCVLLNDITISSGSNFYLANATLYGNGFTFDVSKGAYNGSGQLSNNYLVCLNNAHLDNTKVVGAVYTQYGATTSDDYNRPAVLTYGNSTITNSYISNCASPVRVRDGSLTITNTTLKGGNFANLDIRGGNVTLTDVTTINQANCNDKGSDGSTVIGLGIVVYYEGVTETTITVTDTLTQYNHISNNDQFSNTYAQQLVNAMFDSSYSDLQYTDSNGVKWVNTGIISMTEAINGDNISNVDGYVGRDASITVLGKTVNGYVYTTTPTDTSINATPGEYTPSKQCTIAPSYSFDYTEKNYVGKTEGSNDYCYYDNGTVYISMDQGDSFNWDTSILTAIKNGITLDYTVTLNGTDYTGKSITFNTAGEYTVQYQYTDDCNYYIDANGQLATQSITYTKEVAISVSTVTPDTKHAEFTFGSSNTTSTTITIGDNIYVMPNVTGTSSTIGSTTVDGKTIYYPIVEIIMSDGKTSHTSGWYAYFPVFSGAVTITDYQDKGLGDAETYGSSTTTMPSGLSVVGEPAQLFKYQSSSTAGTSPVVKNNILVYSSPSISAKRSEYNTVIQYSYQDNAGTTYYYYIGYHAPAQSYSSICVSPDTLVTMADGTQKEIQHTSVGDMVVAWNFHTGKYEIVPLTLSQVDGEGEIDVLHLYFDNGTELKVLGEHGIFDADLNNFIFIDTDDVEQYIGHSFIAKDGDSYKETKLIGYSVTTEQTAAYTLLSYEHHNVILEGMFTLSPAHVGDNFFNPFDINDNMMYDEEQVKADIEKYGLYTYDDFADLLTYEQFVALNIAQFKVSVGKGLVTYEGLVYLIKTFINR